MTQSRRCVSMESIRRNIRQNNPQERQEDDQQTPSDESTSRTNELQANEHQDHQPHDFQKGAPQIPNQRQNPFTQGKRKSTDKNTRIIVLYENFYLFPSFYYCSNTDPPYSRSPAIHPMLLHTTLGKKPIVEETESPKIKPQQSPTKSSHSSANIPTVLQYLMTQKHYTKDFITQAPVIHDENYLRAILLQEYGITNCKIQSLTGYDDLNFSLENCQVDLQAHRKLQEFIARDQNKFVLKFTNPVEAAADGLIDSQVKLMEVLLENDVPCAQIIPQRDGKQWNNIQMSENVKLPVRMYSFLPGQMLEDFESKHTNTTYNLVGNLLAKFTDFKTKVMPYKNKMKKGIIHSDFNETNILLMQNPASKNIRVSGLLDFGDTHTSALIYDIANTILYLFLDYEKTENSSVNNFDKLRTQLKLITKHVFEGYNNGLLHGNQQNSKQNSAEPKLLMLDFEQEQGLIGICMKARLVLSLIYGLRTLRINYRQRESPHYVLKTQQNGWRVLKLLCEMDHISVLTLNQSAFRPGRKGPAGAKPTNHKCGLIVHYEWCILIRLINFALSALSARHN
uniref:Hydroxylysine kinase n=1 Tax=Ditylenchus dipsaci TaxID=166011 RepID=A0A915ETF4_9BILA